MARITVEDCLDNVDNRFELVLAATRRARKLVRGEADPLVPWDNDKVTVVALREIAEGLLDPQGDPRVVSERIADNQQFSEHCANTSEATMVVPDLTPPMYPIPPVVASMMPLSLSNNDESDD